MLLLNLSSTLYKFFSKWSDVLNEVQKFGIEDATIVVGVGTAR
jgi:hypothetical protein